MQIRMIAMVILMASEIQLTLPTPLGPMTWHKKTFLLFCFLSLSMVLFLVTCKAVLCVSCSYKYPRYARYSSARSLSRYAVNLKCIDHISSSTCYFLDSKKNQPVPSEVYFTPTQLSNLFTYHEERKNE